MDIILLAGVVLDTTDTAILHNTYYKTVGVCLYNYTKQSCEFVCETTGLEQYLDYIKEHKYYEGFEYSDVASVLSGCLTKRLEESSELLERSLLSDLAVFNSNFSLISSRRYVLLGRLKENHSIAGVVFDSKSMIGYFCIYLGDYYYGDNVKLLYSNVKYPVFYLALSALDFRLSYLDVSNNYYSVGEAGVLNVDDSTTFVVPEGLKALSIQSRNFNKECFDLIIVDDLEYFCIENALGMERIRVYITKNCKCYSIYAMLDRVVKHVLKMNLGFSRPYGKKFRFDKDVVESVVRTNKMRSLRKYMDIVQYYARHSESLNKLYAMDGGDEYNRVDIVLLED